MGKIDRRMKIINRLIWGAAAIAGTVAIIGWVASSEEEPPAPPAPVVRTAATATPTTTTTTIATTTAPTTTTTTTTTPTTTTTAGGGHLMDLVALFAEWDSVQTSLEADIALLEHLCTAEMMEDLFWTRGAEAAIEHIEGCAGISAGTLDTLRRWRPTVQQFTQEWPEIDAGWEMLQITDDAIGALEIQQEDIDANTEEGRALLEELGLG